jgi:hypothetical protein
MSLTTAIEAQTALLASELPLLRPAIDAGTAFPVGTSAGARFWRTDLGAWGFYDGTQWLGPPQFATFAAWSGYAPYSASDFPLLIALTGNIIIDVFALHTYINTPNTTSAFWTFILYRDGTSIWTDDTQDRGVGNNDFSSTVGAQNAASFYNIGIAKTGNPGSVHLAATINFRRIYT